MSGSELNQPTGSMPDDDSSECQMCDGDGFARDADHYVTGLCCFCEGRKPRSPLPKSMQRGPSDLQPLPDYEEYTPRVAADFLAHLLVKHGVIQSAAIEDAEGYDNWKTASAIVNVAIELNAAASNTQAEPR